MKHMLWLAPVAVLIGLHSAAAQPSLLEETEACQGDVLQLCPTAIPDRGAIIACMHQQHASLSQRCAAVFDEATGATPPQAKPKK